jgi:hypothetical protein
VRARWFFPWFSRCVCVVVCVCTCRARYPSRFASSIR